MEAIQDLYKYEKNANIGLQLSVYREENHKNVRYNSGSVQLNFVFQMRAIPRVLSIFIALWNRLGLRKLRREGIMLKHVFAGLNKSHYVLTYY